MHNAVAFNALPQSAWKVRRAGSGSGIGAPIVDSGGSICRNCHEERIWAGGSDWDCNSFDSEWKRALTYSFLGRKKTPIRNIDSCKESSIAM